MGVRAANRKPPHPNPNADALAHQHADAYPDADGNPIAYPDPHADAPAYQHANAYRNTDPDGNARAHPNVGANANAYPRRGNWRIAAAHLRRAGGKPANRHPGVRQRMRPNPR